MPISVLWPKLQILKQSGGIVSQTIRNNQKTVTLHKSLPAMLTMLAEEENPTATHPCESPSR